MALHVFPNCCLREGVEAEAFAFAIRAYRREFLLRKRPCHIDSCTQNVSPRPGRCSVYRIVTVFGKKEFSTIRLYCKRKRLSLYSLAKAAIREYVQRHP